MSRVVLSKALEAQHVKSYKLAGSLFREILRVLPNEKICLRGLGAMALAIKNYSDAATWLQQGARIYPLDVLFHARLGDAHSGLGHYVEALEEYDQALGLVEEQTSAVRLNILDTSTSSDQTRTLGVCEALPSAKGACGKDHTKPQNVDEPNAGDIHGAVTVEGLKIACARVLQKMGDRGTANAIIVTLLKKNPNNLDALHDYGILILDHGLVKDALSIFLKLMLARPSDESTRFGFSKIIKHPQGMEAVKNELKSEELAGHAISFIASSLKHYGAINEAVELYEFAIKLSPSSVAYVLSLIHLYEVRNDYSTALDRAVSMFRSLPQLFLMSLQFSDIIACFEDNYWSQSSYNYNQNSQQQCLRFQAGAEYLRWSDLSSEYEQTKKREQYPELPNNDEIVQRVYDEEHLKVLAILFTVTKIHFLGGALQQAKRLARCIEPARAASAIPLHRTLVRNEAAYFACVYQILENYPIPLPLPPVEEYNPLYLAGDSHCLSAAWRTVQLRGLDCLLVPLLVTGLKVWHLRPASDFYPKIAFRNAMQSVADGAKLVMILGEIDCREGILVAVEKGIYQTIEEGVEVSVKVYLDMLQCLIDERGFELFVHPVPPVLDETRPVVHIFNSILQQRVEALEQTAMVCNRLHWLNIVPDLLTPKGSVKQEFQLDGTHLSPNYKDVLNRELRKFKGSASR